MHRRSFLSLFAFPFLRLGVSATPREALSRQLEVCSIETEVEGEIEALWPAIEAHWVEILGTWEKGGRRCLSSEETLAIIRSGHPPRSC